MTGPVVDHQVPDEPDPPPSSHHNGKTLMAVSNAMVSMHRRHFGRGPDSAKTFAIDEMLVCVMRDVYSPVERTLIDIGQRDRVRETRTIHQLAASDEYKELVSDVTGRKVDGFCSTVSFDPDVAVELFMLGDRVPAG